MKILILGGYGAFGARLATLLGDMPELEMVIAGRSLQKARLFCSTFTGAARVTPVQAERHDIAPVLAACRPDVLVDASGPFQNYGKSPYAVVEACLAERVDYLDLADGTSFVCGIPQFDEQARDRGVFVLSGVSTCPSLTSAVLRELARSVEIRRVWAGIAPSPRAGLGLNVMKAILSYAGSPVRLRKGGVWTTEPGLAAGRRYSIAPPGDLPLYSRRFALVDVPDLQTIPPHYPEMDDFWMGAGTVPAILHRVLIMLAGLRARLGLPSLAALSRPFFLILNHLRFGEHRGGMFVEAEGTRDGKPVTRSWHLVAEGDDGPLIPVMAVASVVRKLQRGLRPVSGARAATHALELDDFEEIFSRKAIVTGFREPRQQGSLYETLLDTAFARLSPSLQALHGTQAGRSWHGVARVTRGKGLIARSIATLFGFPDSASSCPVTVTFAVDGHRERWTRNFGGRRFHSRQRAGSRKNRHLLVESFGPFSFAMALVVEDGALRLMSRRWFFLGVPMPHRFLPTGSVREYERDGLFCFDVHICLPWIGQIVSYEGTLTPLQRTA